jgi:polysaccharide export outer membrane protein
MTPLLLLLSLFVAPQATAPRATSLDYTVGPDDVLDISIVGEPMFTNKYRIRRDGTFEFPNLGAIKASGQTLRSLEEMLTTRLQKENILLRPQITIEVAEFRSQTIYVMGQVADQGMVALTGSKTIVDVLAGRLLPSAGDEIIINRRKPGTEAAGPVLAATDEGIEVIKISRQDVLNGRAASMVTLRDGDTIVVSKGASIYIIGEVKSPGPYVLEGTLTIRQALALAGGPTPRAATNRIEVLRTVNGKETKVKAKLSDLVQPGDTINVPPKRL